MIYISFIHCIYLYLISGRGVVTNIQYGCMGADELTRQDTGV